jgi:peptide/nickel transport system permease protein
MLVLAVLVVSAIAPGLLAPDSPTAMAITSPRTPPSAAHLFGTDQFGRDILSRVIHGVRLSLSIGVLSTLLGVVVGGSIGLVFGFLGGLSDAFAMRVVDVMLAFPSVLLALTIVAVSGPSLVNLILAIGIASVPEYARIVRGQVLSIRERPFMEAAIAAGTRRSGLLLTHVLPKTCSRRFSWWRRSESGSRCSPGHRSASSASGRNPPRPNGERCSRTGARTSRTRGGSASSRGSRS